MGLMHATLRTPHGNRPPSRKSWALLPCSCTISFTQPAWSTRMAHDPARCITVVQRVGALCSRPAARMQPQRQAAYLLSTSSSLSTARWVVSSSSAVLPAEQLSSSSCSTTWRSAGCSSSFGMQKPWARKVRMSGRTYMLLPYTLVAGARMSVRGTIGAPRCVRRCCFFGCVAQAVDFADRDGIPWLLVHRPAQHTLYSRPSLQEECHQHSITVARCNGLVGDNLKQPSILFLTDAAITVVS